MFIKKDNILTFATTKMDLEGIMLNEISQTEEDKCYMFSLICLYVESKNAELTETRSRLMVTRRWVVGEMGRWWSKSTNFQL